MYWICILNWFDDWFVNLEVVELLIKKKFVWFFKLGNKDYVKLYEFLDIVIEIDFLKENFIYLILFVYFDLLLGVNLIVVKLLYSI